MANIEVKTDNTQKFLGNLQTAIAAALEEIGLVAEGYATKLCPVDTGRLRASITHTTDENAAYIGTNVEYAPYVELGTSRQKAQPFLRPAAADHMDTYYSIVQKHVGSIRV